MHYEGYHERGHLGQRRPLLLSLFNASSLNNITTKIKNCKRKDKDTLSYAFISRISDSLHCTDLFMPVPLNSRKHATVDLIVLCHKIQF